MAGRKQPAAAAKSADATGAAKAAPEVSVPAAAVSSTQSEPAPLAPVPSAEPEALAVALPPSEASALEIALDFEDRPHPLSALDAGERAQLRALLVKAGAPEGLLEDLDDFDQQYREERRGFWVLVEVNHDGVTYTSDSEERVWLTQAQFDRLSASGSLAEPEWDEGALPDG